MLPAFRVFNQGPSDQRGWRFSPTLDALGLLSAPQGARVFVSNESEDVTYAATVSQGGALSGFKPFANRGGEAVVQGSDGRVYVANGQVFVYGPDGREEGRIDIPERPIGLAFGGPDRKTLYVLSQNALFSVTR